MRSLSYIAAALLLFGNRRVRTDRRLHGEGRHQAATEGVLPYADRAFPTNVYFGDTHLHIGAVDGCRHVRQSRRVGRGLPLLPRRGGHVLDRVPRRRLGRPLDFVVIADHSDGMGFFSMLAERRSRMVMERRKADAGTRRSGRRRGSGRRCARDHHDVLAGQVPVADE